MRYWSPGVLSSDYAPCMSHRRGLPLPVVVAQRCHRVTVYGRQSPPLRARSHFESSDAVLASGLRTDGIGHPTRQVSSSSAPSFPGQLGIANLWGDLGGTL